MLTPKHCRYGQAGNQTNSSVSKGGIAITVDVQMPENSPLQAVRSPSHPIAVALGRTSASESQYPHLSRASATLSLSTSTLDKDFVLEIIQDVRCFGLFIPIETSTWITEYVWEWGRAFCLSRLQRVILQLHAAERWLLLTFLYSLTGLITRLRVFQLAAYPSCAP